MSIGPPLPIFKSIQPIDMKLGMCTKCLVYFQLSIGMWHLIGLHGNHSNIMTSLVAGAILAFQIFNVFSYSNLNTENSEKTTLSDWNLDPTHRASGLELAFSNLDLVKFFCLSAK